MGLGVSLWGCGKPRELLWGCERRPCRVLVRCPYGSWGVPMGFGVFSVGLWVSLWVLGCPYGSWGVRMGLGGLPMGLGVSYGAVGSPRRAFMGL